MGNKTFLVSTLGPRHFSTQGLQMTNPKLKIVETANDVHVHPSADPQGGRGAMARTRIQFLSPLHGLGPLS